MASVTLSGVVLLLLCVQCAFGTSIFFREKSNLNKLSTWNFGLILHLLETNFPDLHGTSGISTLQILTPRINVTYMAPALPPTFETAQNRLVFKYPSKVATFKLSFYWVLTVLMFPISGTAEAELNMEDASYSILFSGNNVRPALQAKWTLNSLTVENSLMAKVFGIDNTLKTILTQKWQDVVVGHINTNIMDLVVQYFRVRFPEDYNLILSYFDSDHTLSYPHRLASFHVENNSLLYEYVPKTSLSLPSAPISEFAVQYTLGQDMILRIFQELFGKLYPSFELNAAKIPADCIFQLNSQQFAQAIPDFYMQFGKVNISAKTVATDVSKANFTLVSSKQFRIAGMNFNVTFSYNGDKLATGMITLSGLFAPIVSIVPGQRTALIKLNIVSLNAVVKATEKFGELPVMKAGLQSYIQSGLDHWVAKAYNSQVLGNGIYLEFDSVLDEGKSFANVLDTGMNAWIYAKQ